MPRVPHPATLLVRLMGQPRELRIDLSRPLVACVGGPKHKQWYYRDEWDRLVETVKRTANPFTPPAALAALGYKLTTRTVNHPNHDQATAKVLMWTGLPTAPGEPA